MWREFMFWHVLWYIGLTIINYLWITTLIDIIITGLPALRLDKKLHKTSFLIEKENHSEVQGASECSAFAPGEFPWHFLVQLHALCFSSKMPVYISGGKSGAL